MTKYRLKDQELQRKLDAISGNDFSKRLNDTADVWANNPDVVSIAWETGLGKQTLFKVWIPRSDIEEIPKYDPTKWNYWPDVEPPYDVPLRVELVKRTDDKVVVTDRGCASYRPGTWKGMKIPSWTTGGIRFRPWDDHNEEGEE